MIKSLTLPGSANLTEWKSVRNTARFFSYLLQQQPAFGGLNQNFSDTMISSQARKWLPGALFLSAQLINTAFELTQDTRTMSWAPHTTQVFYKIEAFEKGIAWEKQRIEERYGIAQSQWEAHAAGNLRRLVAAVEARKTGSPDSVRISYRRNAAPERVYIWKASL